MLIYMISLLLDRVKKYVNTQKIGRTLLNKYKYNCMKINYNYIFDINTNIIVCIPVELILI